ncbi:YybS family protein [Bacillus timonensis]|nr:YybS family protein [Bacillus timonensis]
MKRTRSLTEGALLLAVYGVLLILSLYIPFMSFIMFLLPIPAIVYAVRYDHKKAILFFIGALPLSILIGSVFGLVYVLLFVVNGLVLGTLIRKRMSRFVIFIGGSLAYLASIMILYITAQLIFQINFTDYFIQASEESVQLFNDTLARMGQEADPKMLEQIDEALSVFTYLLPSFFIMTALFFSLITQLIATPVLRRLKIDVSSWKAFKDIQLPRSLLWYYLLVMILTLINLEEGSFIYIAVLNLFYILQFLMIVQGLSFIYFFCDKKGISKGVPIIITILTPFLMYIIRFLGIIDLGFQLRDRIKSKK